MGVLISVLLILLSALPVWADGYHWVRTTGTQTTWDNCRTATDTPPADDNANYCTWATANTNADNGDMVYYREGTYTLSLGQIFIEPSHSGTSSVSLITFSAYNNEVITVEQSAASYGFYLDNVDYIKITGFYFHNISNTNTVTGGSDYNEISYCKFVNDTADAKAASFRMVGLGVTASNTHNWFHHNYLSSRHNADPCAESTDLMRIGMSSADDANDNNTVENNYFEYSGHANLVVYGHKNVIRNNIAHNEPWIEGCTSYSTGNYGTTSSSSVAIGTGSKSFTIASGLTGFTAGHPVAVVYNTDHTQAMWGLVSSYSGTTLTLNITKVATGASGTYDDWTLTVKTYPEFTDTDYNGLYSHRVFSTEHQASSSGGVTARHLWEGNRIGFAGINPNNGGADCLDINTNYNIIRYNYVYGAMGSGIAMKPYYKDQCDACYNTVYNNTSYYNGRGYDWTIYSGLNADINAQGIMQDEYGSANVSYNKIKNNLVYDNGGGDICKQNSGAGCSPDTSMDTVENNLTGTDPDFSDPDMSDPTSQNLFADVHGYAATPIPDLSLQSSSVAAIDGGTYLTTVHSDDTGSGDSLIVTDANYFQAGSTSATNPIGSSLSSVAGDYIKVGATLAAAEETQITDINYTTNTLTINPAITRADGEYVWLSRKSDGTVVLYGNAPEYGAYEYEPAYDVTVSSSGAGCTYSKDGVYSISSGETLNVTVTVNNGWQNAWSGTCPATGTTTRICTPTGDSTVVGTCTELLVWP